MFSRLLGQASIVTLAGLIAPAAIAQEANYSFDIPSQSLADALRAYGQTTGEQIIFRDAEIGARQSAALVGSYTSNDALTRLLEGSGLVYARRASGVLVVQDPNSPTQLGDAGRAAPSEDGEADLVVTGTRIRGAPPSVPVISVSNDDMRNAGQNDLGEVIRSIPQNFGGGQNPGVGNSQGAFGNVNVQGASSLNLRGMGPDATLTLLNGSRLAYNGLNAAVDISAIPSAAVARVEILPDGASALYGSDAVAGVANIVLRRDFEGAQVSARFGAATDGGGEQQQYGALIGRVWESGSLLAAYDYSQYDGVFAGDRDFTSTMHPQTHLFPEMRRDSALISVQQSITNSIGLVADVIWKDNEHYRQNGIIIGQPISYVGLNPRAYQTTLGIAPRLEIELQNDWTATISGFWGIDDTEIHGANTIFGVTSRPHIRYDNSAYGVEANAEGALFEIPGGDLRLAFGAGYRQSAMELYRATDGVVGRTYDVSQDSYFAFGEVYAPIISAANRVGIVRGLSLSAALRYEDYADMGDVVTPKIGANLDLGADLRLSGSWGRSFKAPSFYQLYSEQYVTLYDVTGYGSTFPASSTYLVTGGSNPDLGPEEAESWTLSLRYRPSTIPGLELSASLFDTDYTDRIATPIASLTGALTNPNYAEFVTLAPTIDQINAALATADSPLQNGTSGPLDPSTIVGIVNTRNRNIARETYRGVDVAGRYDIALGGDKALSLSLSASYLESERQVRRDLPVEDLAGLVFNPTQLRVRAGGVFDAGRYTLASYVSYIGGVEDRRTSTVLDVDAMTTLDLTGRVDIGHGVELGLNALNVFNAEPDMLVTSSPYDTSYDTTNYSGYGRFIAISLTKTW